MISPDGWLSWAEKMPGRAASGPGFNAGVNGVRGLVFHSAEGWAETMLSKTSQWGYYSAQYPWHLSNLLDGRLIQHYPFTARCWHGSAFNENYVGMENEGVTPHGATTGPALNDMQIFNARRVIASLSEWKGWAPKRPTSASDKTATLYEHTEVVRFGGSGTQCPSRRVPWDLILAEQEEEIMDVINGTAPSLRGRKVTPDVPSPVRLTDFDVAIPPTARRLRIEVYLASTDPPGIVQLKHGDGDYAFQVGWDGARYGLGEVDVGGGGFSIQGSGTLAQVGVVAVA